MVLINFPIYPQELLGDMRGVCAHKPPPIVCTQTHTTHKCLYFPFRDHHSILETRNLRLERKANSEGSHLLALYLEGEETGPGKAGQRP